MPRKSRSGRSSYETKRTSMRGNENFFAKGLTNALFCGKLIKSSGVMPRSRICADVAELADALDSGSSESNFMWVQVPSLAPKKDCNFDTKLQSFLTKSAFVGINPLRG